MINAAFANRDDATIVCPYDTRALSTAVIADAEATHPVIWQDGHETPSPHYAPEHVVARYNQPPTRAADAVGYTLVEPHDLAGVRKLIAAHAVGQGDQALAQHRIERCTCPWFNARRNVPSIEGARI